MESFLSKISRVKPNDIFRVSYKYNAENRFNMEVYNMHLEDEVKRTMMDGVNKFIYEKISEIAKDLTNISKFKLSSGLIEMEEFIYNFNVEHVLLSPMYYGNIMERLGKDKSIPFSVLPRKLNEYGESLIIYGENSNTTYHVNPFLKWDHNYVYFMDTINLEMELSEYFKFSDINNEFHLLLEPINMSPIYKLKIN